MAEELVSRAKRDAILYELGEAYQSAVLGDPWPDQPFEFKPEIIIWYERWKRFGGFCAGGLLAQPFHATMDLEALERGIEHRNQLEQINHARLARAELLRQQEGQ